MNHSHMVSLLKHKFQGPIPRVSDSADLGQACISNTFPGDSEAAGLGSHLESHWTVEYDWEVHFLKLMFNFKANMSYGLEL